MRTIVRKSRFKKDFKKLLSSGKDIEKLAEIRRLQEGQPLPERCKDHNLIDDHMPAAPAASNHAAAAEDPPCDN